MRVRKGASPIGPNLDKSHLANIRHFTDHQDRVKGGDDGYLFWNEWAFVQDRKHICKGQNINAYNLKSESCVRFEHFWLSRKVQKFLPLT